MYRIAKVSIQRYIVIRYRALLGGHHYFQKGSTDLEGGERMGVGGGKEIRQPLIVEVEMIKIKSVVVKNNVILPEMNFFSLKFIFLKLIKYSFFQHLYTIYKSK